MTILNEVDPLANDSAAIDALYQRIRRSQGQASLFCRLIDSLPDELSLALAERYLASAEDRDRRQGAAWVLTAMVEFPDSHRVHEVWAEVLTDPALRDESIEFAKFLGIPQAPAKHAVPPDSAD